MLLIFAGDFNCILQRKDRKGAAEDFKEDKTTILLKNITTDFRLTDVFKSMHPNNAGYTWFSGDGKRASRIDYIFIRDWSLMDARSTPLFFSDHTMLSCTLSLPPWCDYRQRSLEVKLFHVRGSGYSERIQRAV